MAKDATIVTLGTGESFAQYNRKRMSMSFDKEPGPSQPKKRKSHSPNDENINWNTEQVLIDLRQMQPGVRINWSLHGIMELMQKMEGKLSKIS